MILLPLHLPPINVIVYDDPKKSNLVAGFVLRCFQHLSNPDLDTRPEDGVPPLVRGQQVQAAFAGQFHIHAQAVGEVTQLLQKLRAGAGDPGRDNRPWPPRDGW